jgi:undecaprenyl-diphosphatase
VNILENIIIGIIQGLTEFIPVSSSGHLVIVQNFFSGASDHLLLEAINVGTVLALLVYFRRRIISIVRDILIDKQYRLAINILITALPAGIVGFLLASYIEASGFFGSLVVVTVTLGAVGVVMVLLERFPKSSASNIESLSPWRAMLIGLAQILALVPGVSRSGSTMIVGRLVGLSAASAAEYSFLVSLPIMLGLTLKTFLSDGSYLVDNLGVLIIGNTAAFITGMLAISFLMKYLSRHSLALFGWYRIGLSVVLAMMLLIQ